MKALIYILALVTSTSVVAQETATPNSDQQTAVTVSPLIAEQGPTADTRIIRGGAQIRVRFLNELTTEDRASSVGDRVRLEVAEDVVSDGVTIIPRGTPVTGEITAVRNKGMWGRSGKIEGRILSMTLNGRTVRMSGAFDDKGVTGTAGVVAAVVLVPVVGFFVTGTSARIPAGSEISAYIDEDVVFTVTAAAPVAPIQVAAPTTELAPATAP